MEELENVEEVNEHQDSVELLYIDGNDERIAQAAWTSSTIDLTEERKSRVASLVHTLWKSGHTSPFEHSSITFRMIVNNSTHIQMLKHRIGVSFNVESARYRSYRKNKTYIPDDLCDEWKSHLLSATESCWKLYHRIIADHEKLGLDKSRAKEIAKFFLPMSTQVEMFVTFNLRSFFHFQSLRNESHSQKEIQELAQKMWELVEKTNNFRHAMEAYSLYSKTN
jgi:thymidylate synthase (FAD)